MIGKLDPFLANLGGVGMGPYQTPQACRIGARPCRIGCIVVGMFTIIIYEHSGGFTELVPVKSPPCHQYRSIAAFI
jgi:hypothetical protein